MTCEGFQFLHFGHLPYVDLIEGVAVGADKLVDCFREHQVADL